MNYIDDKEAWSANEKDEWINRKNQYRERTSRDEWMKINDWMSKETRTLCDRTRYVYALARDSMGHSRIIRK